MFDAWKNKTKQNNQTKNKEPCCQGYYSAVGWAALNLQI